jgi:Xaa-Pro aminopeptidase
VFTEISASFREYSGQVLRSFTVNCEPTPLYRELHAAAEAGFKSIVAIAKPGSTPSDLVRAGQVIEEAGFTICDDLVHGYGGGYFQPVLGLPSRRTEPLPDLALEEGMMNVVTHDRTAGVQTGECLRITATGCESLHKAPSGFLRTLAP